MNDRPDFERRYAAAVARAKSNKTSHDFKYPDSQRLFEPFNRVLTAMTGEDRDRNKPMEDWKYLTDNHTHTMRLSTSQSAVASSTYFENMVLDWVLIDEFDLRDCDPIHNSTNAVFYESLSHGEAPPSGQRGESFIT